MHLRSPSTTIRSLQRLDETPLNKTSSNKSSSSRHQLPPLRFPPPTVRTLSDELLHSSKRQPTTGSISRPTLHGAPLSTIRSVHFTDPIVVLPSARSSRDLIDENNLTKKPIETLLHELVNFKYETQFKSAYQITNLEQMRFKKVEAQKKVLSLFEDILCLYKIRFDIVSGFTSDSFMDIDGVTDKHELVRAVQKIAPLICKFPYSFFRKLKIVNISFCDEFYLHKSGRENFGANRAHIKGLFPLKELDTEEKVTDYFYQFIFTNLRASVPSFDRRYTTVVKNQKNRMSMAGRALATAQNFGALKVVVHLNEEWTSLRDLINDPSAQLFAREENVRTKAMALRVFLQELDPEGITNKWWDKMGCPVQPDYDVIYAQISESKCW